MASNEIIKSGKYYRVYDGENWNRMHFVTDAKSVLTDDGKTVETTLATINENLGGLRFGTDGDGNVGYYGADGSLIPFSSGGEGDIEFVSLYHEVFQTNTATGNVSFTGTIPVTLSPGKHELVCMMKSDSGKSNNYCKSKNIIANGYDLNVEYDPNDYFGTLVKSVEVELEEETTIDINFEGTHYYSGNHYEHYMCFVFDYIKTSSESTDEIEIVPLVPTLTSNTGSDGGEVICSGYSTNDNYPYYAFDGKGDTSWYDNGHINNPYIGYKFINPVIVDKVSIKGYGFTSSSVEYTLTLQASNNNSDWIDLGTCKFSNSGTNMEGGFAVFDSNAYIYYRVVSSNTRMPSASFCVTELQFYGYKLEALIPTMTSNTGNTCDVGSVVYDTYVSDSLPWHAFDNSDLTWWRPAQNQNVPYIGFVFNESKFINVVTIKSRGSNTLTANIEVTTDGTTWNVLQTNCSIKNNDVFAIDGKYKGVRFIRNGGDSWHTTNLHNPIIQIQFYGAPKATSSGGNISPKTIDKKTDYAFSYSYDVEIGKTYILNFSTHKDIDTSQITVTGGEKLLYEESAESYHVAGMTVRICIAKATESTMTFDAISQNIFYPMLICLD